MKENRKKEVNALSDDNLDNITGGVRFITTAAGKNGAGEDVYNLILRDLSEAEIKFIQDNNISTSKITSQDMADLSAKFREKGFRIYK